MKGRWDKSKRKKFIKFCKKQGVNITMQNGEPHMNVLEMTPEIKMKWLELYNS